MGEFRSSYILKQRIQFRPRLSAT